MESVDFLQLRDRVAPRSGSGSLDPASLVGTWVNTNEDSRGIVKVVLAAQEGSLAIRAFGAGDPEPLDWGETAVDTLYGDSLLADNAISFVASNDLGFLETELHANVSKGLLIIAAMNRFKDGSGRSNYFSREFYRRVLANQ